MINLLSVFLGAALQADSVSSYPPEQNTLHLQFKGEKLYFGLYHIFSSFSKKRMAEDSNREKAAHKYNDYFTGMPEYRQL